MQLSELGPGRPEKRRRYALASHHSLGAAGTTVLSNGMQVQVWPVGQPQKRGPPASQVAGTALAPEPAPLAPEATPLAPEVVLPPDAPVVTPVAEPLAPVAAPDAVPEPPLAVPVPPPLELPLGAAPELLPQPCAPANARRARTARAAKILRGFITAPHRSRSGIRGKRTSSRPDCNRCWSSKPCNMWRPPRRWPSFRSSTHTAH